MRSRRGFTLIELLAVIVILGVIMVIAVPAVTKYIEKSRKDGFTKTASGVVDAARLYYSNEYGQSGESTIEFECTTKECKSEDGKKLELTKSPDKGTVKIFDNGEIIACFQRDMWYAVKNLNDNEVTFGEGKCEYDEESNSYDTIPLVSREMVDELQDQMDELREQKDGVIAAKQAEIDTLKSKGDAKATEILETKKAMVKGTEVVGTMKNNGTLSKTITAGQTFTLPEGYYAGGTLSATSTKGSILYAAATWPGTLSYTATKSCEGAVITMTSNWYPSGPQELTVALTHNGSRILTTADREVHITPLNINKGDSFTFTVIGGYGYMSHMSMTIVCYN